MTHPRAASRTTPAIAVLCSGQGTNLQAILKAIRRRQLQARLALVISDRPKAKALLRAQRAGVEAQYLNPSEYPSRADYERALIALCAAHGVKAICLAGFMRMLSPVFVRHFRHRILNIHPALLPAFPGAHAARDALAWGAKVTGVTVHLVDEEMDHGPIVLQQAVPIRPADSEASLVARLHRVEHQVYPRAIQLLLDGRLRLDGRRVRRW